MPEVLCVVYRTSSPLFITYIPKVQQTVSLIRLRQKVPSPRIELGSKV